MSLYQTSDHKQSNGCGVIIPELLNLHDEAHVVLAANDLFRRGRTGDVWLSSGTERRWFSSGNAC